MKVNFKRIVAVALAISCVNASFGALAAAKPVARVLTPVAGGTTVFESGKVILDASNASKGYIMVKHSGSGKAMKVRVYNNQNNIYTYDLKSTGDYDVFPLTEGNGAYTIEVFEQLKGKQYTQLMSQKVNVKLEDEFLPFLYPNQYVNFTAKSNAVKKAGELAAKAKDDVEIVKSVYDFVTKNIKYDNDKAQNVQYGYLPVVDNVLKEKKGICFDYAALMTSMLRSQGIPTRLLVGYKGEIYHAWISVYLQDKGWVNNVIFFDGNDWRIMDPTFAAGDAADSYSPDTHEYRTKYTY